MSNAYVYALILITMVICSGRSIHIELALGQRP